MFLVHVRNNAYGGLEHRSSTALHISPDELPISLDEPISKKYLNFLTLCSHEYFHTWNIKQIKPKHFVPYDLYRETPTELLWVFEGFTSFYEDRLVFQSGLITKEEYLKNLERSIFIVSRGKGSNFQSIAESSYDAWTKFYKQDENAPNVIASYYTKGKLTAFCLDIYLRKHSEGKWSLDDVMKYLWREFGKKSIGVDERSIGALIENLTSISVSSFIDDHVYGCKALPLEESFSDVGISLNWLSHHCWLPSETAPSNPDVALGATLVSDSSGAKVRTGVF